MGHPRLGSFRWHDTLLGYFDHPHNNSRNNERAVELSIVGDWLHTAAGTPEGQVVDGLEVGNVLQHYACPWPRRIVDLYEVADDVENIDVLAIEGEYPWIVSVSTLEHVGIDDGADDPSKAVHALLHLRGLLAIGGRMLVTIPFGANPAMDEAITAESFAVTRQCTLHRHQAEGELPWWDQADDPVAPVPLQPLVASAQAVWIGEWA